MDNREDVEREMQDLFAEVFALREAAMASGDWTSYRERQPQIAQRIIELERMANPYVYLRCDC